MKKPEFDGAAIRHNRKAVVDFTSMRKKRSVCLGYEGILEVYVRQS